MEISRTTTIRSQVHVEDIESPLTEQELRFLNQQLQPTSVTLANLNAKYDFVKWFVYNCLALRGL